MDGNVMKTLKAILWYPSCNDVLQQIDLWAISRYLGRIRQIRHPKKHVKDRKGILKEIFKKGHHTKPSLIFIYEKFTGWFFRIGKATAGCLRIKVNKHCKHESRARTSEECCRHKQKTTKKIERGSEWKTIASRKSARKDYQLEKELQMIK